MQTNANGHCRPSAAEKAPQTRENGTEGERDSRSRRTASLYRVLCIISERSAECGLVFCFLSDVFHCSVFFPFSLSLFLSSRRKKCLFHSGVHHGTSDYGAHRPRDAKEPAENSVNFFFSSFVLLSPSSPLRSPRPPSTPFTMRAAVLALAVVALFAATAAAQTCVAMQKERERKRERRTTTGKKSQSSQNTSVCVCVSLSLC